MLITDYIKLFIKNVCLFAELLFSGMFVAIVIYPILHESGHILSTLLVGGKVIEVNLYPVPSIICEVGDVGKGEKAFIGCAGMALPIIISFMLPGIFFLSRYIRLVLRLMGILSIMMSVIALNYGVEMSLWAQDDIVIVKEILGADKTFVSMLLMVICIVLLISVLYCDNPQNIVKKYHKFGKHTL